MALTSKELEGWGLLHKYRQTQIAVRPRMHLEKDRNGQLIRIFEVFTMFPYGTGTDDDGKSKDYHR